MNRLIQITPLLALLLAPLPLQAEGRTPQGPRATPLSIGRQVYKQHRSSHGKGFRPGINTLVKGRLCIKFPRLMGREVKLSKRKMERNPDPTFKRSHPMFQRLVKEGWYGKTRKIGRLQRLANSLRTTRKLDANTPLKDVEFLAFDLEATNGRAGKFDRGKGKFLSGYDEVTQFGYTIYRNGKKVGSGSIPIKPDVEIHPKVQQLTKLTPAKLANAPRFESAAKQILKLMKGRVLIGQSAVAKDWSWLKSNYARIGVDMPGPRRLIMDTHLLSFNHFDKGAGLAALTQHFRVKQRNHHDAKYDAMATGDVFFAMMRKAGIKTLGQAMAAQEQGYHKMKNPPTPQQ